MTQAQREERLDHIGRGLLGYASDIGLAECPRCGQPAVKPTIHDNAVVFECVAPSTKRNRTEEGLCGYRRIVERLSTADLPKPVFAEKKPVAPATRPARKRSC
jgi:hypothetical protein